MGRLLLRPEEVAEALGVGRTTVFELIRIGRAAVGEDRQVPRRIPTDAVLEFVDGLGA